MTHHGDPTRPDRGDTASARTPFRRRAFLMIWDGLRPDMITEEYTPHLHRLAASGVRFADSHAVFPSVTRCNSATIATGALPPAHGIPANTFYAPEVEPDRPLNAGDATQLERFRPVRDGKVLLRETMGERIARAGGRTAVVSTGSPGSALLQHPEAGACGDLLMNPAVWRGITRAQIEAKLGPMPSGSLPNTAQNAWFTRIITDYLLADVALELLTFWHTDPDRTQHDRGIGHPDTLRSLRDADDNLGAVRAAMGRMGTLSDTNVIVTSDHGFSTITGQIDLETELVRAGLKQSSTSTDVIVSGNSINIPGGDGGRLARIVTFLQGLEAVGPLFTGAGGGEPLPGTHALAAIGADGALAPDILFSLNWGDEANAHGWKGTCWSLPVDKVATHGAISSWEMRNSLVAAGPDFKSGVVSDVPAGNADIAPTLLHLLGLPLPNDLDGRVLHEALTGGPPPETVAVERNLLHAEVGAFMQWVQISRAGGGQYLDFGRVERGT